MAGLFPEGKEFNVYCDVPASKVVADEWPTEIVFSGFEIGNVILTGKKLVQMNVENSPVKDAYALCFTEGDPEGRMSWDHTAVLVAQNLTVHLQGIRSVGSLRRMMRIVSG